MSTITLFLTMCLASPGDTSFNTPLRLTAGNDVIKVEKPGWAAPSWHDMDADGKKDLIVGQFNDGKMRWFKNLGTNNFAPGKWIEAGGKVAEVPGVW